jgi:hypothetical protein
MTITVPVDATGQVLVDVDGVGYYVNVTGGTGSLVIPYLTSGSHSINLTYIGDGKYLPSNNVTSVNVEKIDSFVIPQAHDIYVGEDEVITLILPVDATGNVTVVVDGDEYVFPLTSGVLGAPISSPIINTVTIGGGNGVLILSGLPYGDYVVTVRYNGDGKYNKAVNHTTFKVFKKDTEIEVIDQGNGTVVVIVGDNATGNVTVVIDNQTYVVNVTNGAAIIDLTNATPGEHNITVIYSGDDGHNGSTANATVVIPKYYTPISVTAHDIYVGDTEVITVTVPKAATGKITIEINAKEYTSTIKNGKAVFYVKGLYAGDKTVAVKYSGDKNYRDNYTTGQFTVSKSPTTVKATSSNINVGTDEIITAAVLPKDATGRVLVDINGIGYYAVLINGKAKVVVPELFAGNYVAKVTYEGDDKYLPSYTTTSFKVKKVKTPIRADGDEIWQGENATVIVRVPEDATGTITINVKGQDYTAEVEGGKAIFTVPGLTKGDYDVDARYSGNKKYEANDTITDIEVLFAEPEYYNATLPANDTANATAHSESAKAGVNLADYPTGNPIVVLILVLLSIGSVQLRRFRK